MKKRIERARRGQTLGVGPAGRTTRVVVAVLLGVYVLVLLDLTLVILPGDHPAPNVVPFRSIVHDIRHGGRDLWVNFAGNIVAFLPAGLLIPLVGRRSTRAWRVAALCAALSGGIEVAQFASGRRVADVDDVILNTTGGLIGYGCLAGLRRLRATPSPPRP